MANDLSTDHQSSKLARYTAESCTERGFGWIIDAPEDVCEGDLQRLHSALCDWTDHPQQQDLVELLSDESTLRFYDLNNVGKLKAVRIKVTPVHREVWAQSFERDDQALV